MPVLAVVGCALVLILSNRRGQMPNGMPEIQSDAQYEEALEQITKSTPTAVGKFNTGVDLDQADKDAALQGAKTFDTMNAYRPEMAAGYFEAGLLYYLAGDSDTARNRIGQSLADAPMPENLKMSGDTVKVEGVVADCHHILSLIDFDGRQYKQAAEEAGLAIQHMANRENYYVARARAEIQLNDSADANKDLAKALSLNPNSPMALKLKDFLAH